MDNDDSLWADEDDDVLVYQVDAALEAEETNKRTAFGGGLDGPNINMGVPLELYRPGYLFVSDLSTQNWCEQALDYTFTLPTITVENPVMTKGSDIHLARELEVHDTVQIKTTSQEDKFAVKILNLTTSIESFLTGNKVCREIPVFGAPWGLDVFFMGVIDEIRCQPETFSFDIVEFKTRSHPSVPGKAQRNANSIQVMLYKQLFDDLIRGITTKQTIEKHLRLQLHKTLGDEVLSHALDSGFKLQSFTLDSLLDILFDKMQCIPFISQLFVEYCHQEDCKTIAITEVDFDSNKLEKICTNYISYWVGRRTPKGVDIEDAWKCHRCEFADVCDWRKTQEEQCRTRNARK